MIRRGRNGPSDSSAIPPVLSPAESEESVRGERGDTSVNRVLSLQSRVSSVMACSLMIVLGGGMLTWYYSNALSRQARARQNAQSAAASRAQGEMPLPTIRQFESVGSGASDASRSSSGDATSVTADGTAGGRPQGTPAPQLPLLQAQANWAAMGGAPSAYGAQPAQYANLPPKSPAQLALERRLSGASFEHVSQPGEISNNSTANSAAAGLVALAGGSVRSDSDIAPLLRPSVVASAQARILPTQRFLLAKGAFIDCTLETAIDSTLPGMTTCITATDTFGVDGNVVLLERGTKLIGETRGQVQQGAARVFVLWTEARTPTGIVVPLDSPAADELGRSGLTGQVDHHFWDRFGAAILISTLDGAVQSAVQSSSRGNGAVIYNPSTSESIVTDVLKSSVNIAPTITKRNGDRIQVFVARDLDFRSVYELRTAASGR